MVDIADTFKVLFHFTKLSGCQLHFFIKNVYLGKSYMVFFAYFS